jgi:hypothetical protein
MTEFKAGDLVVLSRKHYTKETVEHFGIGKIVDTEKSHVWISSSCTKAVMFNNSKQFLFFLTDKLELYKDPQVEFMKMPEFSELFE